MSELFHQSPVFFLIAGISTVLFVLKIGLLTMGLGKDVELGDALDGLDHLQGSGSSAAFTFISSQTVLAFLMGFGWLGLASDTEWNFSVLVTLPVAIIFGLAMMLLTAWSAWWLAKLETVRTFNRWSLIGSQGKIYLSIPPKGEGEGQIELVVSGSRKVVRAINQGSEPIPSFSEAVVVAVEGTAVIVKKKDASNNLIGGQS